MCLRICLSILTLTIDVYTRYFDLHQPYHLRREQEPLYTWDRCDRVITSEQTGHPRGHVVIVTSGGGVPRPLQGGRCGIMLRNHTGMGPMDEVQVQGQDLFPPLIR